MRDGLLRFVFCLLAGTLSFPNEAAAQYLFLDSDGDANCDYPFEPISSNSRNVVDVWIDTAEDAAGNPTICPTGEAMSISGYEVVFRVGYGFGGNVAFNGWTNRVAQFTEDLGSRQEGEVIRVGYSSQGTATYLPPGRYLLGTLDVTLFTRCPTIEIVSSGTVSGTPYETNFSTQCAGADDDHTLRLGVDFLDTCGAGPICSDIEGSTWGKIKQQFK
jgi:hypothetical protein